MLRFDSWLCMYVHIQMFQSYLLHWYTFESSWDRTLCVEKIICRFNRYIGNLLIFCLLSVYRSSSLFVSISKLEMIRSLLEEKQLGVCLLLQKGWSVRKVVSSLHVSVSCVQRLPNKYFPDAKVPIGGKPCKVSNRMEMSYSKEFYYEKNVYC